MTEFPDWDSPENRRFLALFRNADFDPLSGLMMAGSAMSAMGTIAGGNAAAAYGQAQKQAADFQATQDVMNSAAAIAAASRRAIETSQKANLVRSSAVAGAAAGGVTTTTGSPLTNEAQIGARGRYAAALDMWNGQNAASGDLNKAAAEHYSGLIDEMGGRMKQEASMFSAFGTLASGGASAFKQFGMGSGGFGFGGGSGGGTIDLSSFWNPVAFG